MVCRLVTGCAAICAVLVVIAGCQESDRCKPPLAQDRSVRHISPLVSEVVDIGVRSERTGDFKFGNFKNTRINNRDIRVPLPPCEVLETDGYALIKVKQTVEINDKPVEFDYTVLLAADPDRNKPARGQVRNSLPNFVLDEGWAFIWGRMPIVTTGWVSAGATGSTIAAKIFWEDGKPVHRIFYLREPEDKDKHRMNVWCPPTKLRPPVEDTCKYVEAKEEDSLEELCVKNASDSVKRDLQWIKEIAKAVGWNEEWGIDCTTKECP